MNKPILFVVYISLACCVGFIVGVYFGGFYSRDIVYKAANEFDDLRELFDKYKIIAFDDIVLEDLNSIDALEDLAAVKEKYKKSGLSNIRMFKKQAAIIKKNASNSAPIIALEKQIEEFEEHFNENEP